MFICDECLIPIYEDDLDEDIYEKDIDISYNQILIMIA